MRFVLPKLGRRPGAPQRGFLPGLLLLLLALPLGLAGCQSCVTDSAQPAETVEQGGPTVPVSSAHVRPRLAMPHAHLVIRDASDDE